MRDLPDLRRWLRAHPSADAELSLSRTEVKALHDELKRLSQSNDMLRKQNRKVRGKFARLRDPAGSDGGEPADR